MLTTILYSTSLAFHGGALGLGPGPAPGPVSTPCGLQQPLDPQLGGASYDCSESQDTGFDAGNPFDITVVTIDGKPVEKDTANAFWVMREAAAADGVDIQIVSGFRTMDEQEYLYMCYECCCCNNCNLAAAPGYSNHQSGHALDINSGGPGVYSWLVDHGSEYGFSATVPSEDWHWEWWGGGPGGGICDIAAAPTGTLDAGACEAITGWTQDPDTPEATLEVHVYFGGPASDPLAVSVPIVADLERPDLCDPLGSCNHAFSLEVPLSLQDGVAHAVHVYGIDSEGAANAELSASPQQLQCPAPPLPAGVRRLATAEVIAAWGLSTFWRMLRVDQAELAALDEWTALAPAALLVRTADAPQVWWIDAGWRRLVGSPEIAAAWGLDLAEAQIVTDEIVDQWREGTPMRELPTLASVDGLTVYLIDDAQHGAPAGDDAGGSDESDGGETTTDGDDDPDTTGSDGQSVPGGASDTADGCGCASGAPSGWALLAPLLLIGGGPRRRR